MSSTNALFLKTEHLKDDGDWLIIYYCPYDDTVRVTLASQQDVEHDELGWWIAEIDEEKIEICGGQPLPKVEIRRVVE